MICFNCSNTHDKECYIIDGEIVSISDHVINDFISINNSIVVSVNTANPHRTAFIGNLINQQVNIIEQYPNCSIRLLGGLEDSCIYFVLTHYSDSISYKHESEVLYIGTLEKGFKKMFETEGNIVKVEYEDKRKYIVLLTDNGSNSNNITKYSIELASKIFKRSYISIENRYYYENSNCIAFDSLQNLSLMLKELGNENSNYIMREGREIVKLKIENISAIQKCSDGYFLINSINDKVYNSIVINENYQVKAKYEICSSVSAIYLKDVYRNKNIIMATFLNHPNESPLSSKTLIYFSKDGGQKWQELDYDGNGVYKIVFNNNDVFILSKESKIYTFHFT